MTRGLDESSCAYIHSIWVFHNLPKKALNPIPDTLNPKPLNPNPWPRRLTFEAGDTSEEPRASPEVQTTGAQGLAASLEPESMIIQYYC